MFNPTVTQAKLSILRGALPEVYGAIMEALGAEKGAEPTQLSMEQLEILDAAAWMASKQPFTRL
ncbi:MAG: hypothetical protein HQL57_10945 [Magnetococcales bacterium]|nr:hypothetical protein [Magnetococcales bacterium]MBF0157690.1 hypothetical protein [Magnetococcales bacterium]